MERMLCLQSYRAVREDTEHLVFTVDQLSRKVESGVGQGPCVEGKKSKQLSSTSHENTSQEEAAQMLVHNDVYSLAPDAQDP